VRSEGSLKQTCESDVQESDIRRERRTSERRTAKSISIKDARLCRETGASITIQSSDELEQLRARLRKMPDDELMGFGKAARSCAGTQDAPTRLGAKWKRRVLKWRRRHPKSAVKT